MLASAGAVDSPWVNREVDWWLTNRNRDQMVIVATSPGMGWDQAEADFAQSAPVPTAMRGKFPNEPLWVDLSELPLGARAADIPDEKVATIAAAIRGVAKDTLIGENLREHRRAMRLARGTIAILAVLSILALTASVIAARSAGAASAAALAATSGQLAAESETITTADPVQAAKLATASWQLAPTARARALARVSLLDVAAQPYRGAIAIPGDSAQTPYHSVAFSPDSNTSACTFDRNMTWGDGTASKNIVFKGGPAGARFVAAHTYSAPGTYIIYFGGKVRGPCTIHTPTFQFQFLSS